MSSPRLPRWPMAALAALCVHGAALAVMAVVGDGGVGRATQQEAGSPTDVEAIEVAEIADDKAPDVAEPPRVRVAATVRRARAVQRGGGETSAPAMAPVAAAPLVTDVAEPLDLTAGAIVVAPHAGALPASGGGGQTAPVGAGDQGRSGVLHEVALEGSDWSCPWPQGGEGGDRDEAEVVLSVLVAPSGQATDVRVISEPGAGFGAAARACAASRRFRPARRADGTSATAWSPPIRVRFVR